MQINDIVKFKLPGRVQLIEATITDMNRPDAQVHLEHNGTKLIINQNLLEKIIGKELAIRKKMMEDYQDFMLRMVS